MTDLSRPRPPADQDQRDAALDLERSFIVQAPAGSGKTELLTQRLLKLLGRVERPERVLAITFTRKATQEMRERIMRRLRQAAAGDAPKPHEAEAVRLAQGVLENDAWHGWHLLDHPGRLRILTIDSLCANLLQRSPEHGAAVSGLRLMEQPKPLYRRAVRSLFEDLDDPESLTGTGLGDGVALHESLVRVLTHLEGDVAQLEDLLIGMLRIRDQWVDPEAEPVPGRPRPSMRDVLRYRQAAEYAAFRDILGGANVDNAIRLACELGAESDSDHADTAPAAALARLLRSGVNDGSGTDANPGTGTGTSTGTGADTSAGGAAVPGAGNDPFETVLATVDTGTADPDVVAAWCLAQLLTTKAGKFRGKTAIKPAFFKNAGEHLAPQATALGEIHQRWFENPVARDAIERMAKYPPLTTGEFDDRILQDVVALLRVLLVELNVAMSEEGATDFQHLAQAALNCLEPAPDGGISPVLMAEDQRLDHLLVDEFQDTSHTQHRLIAHLTEGWQPGDGRTLFLVGDPMQSIYRFRQADVGLFTRVVREQRMGEVPVELLRLTANFRSAVEIVDWANARFRTIFPAEERRDSGAVAYHPAVAEREPGGHVRIHPLAPDYSDEDEAREIAGLIRDCRARLDDPEIAVLVRARSHLRALAHELSRQGIAFEAVDVDPLTERPAIQDLRAIARVLAQPSDRVAWLALLRAPWCALTVPWLHRLAGERRDADILQRLGHISQSVESNWEEEDPMGPPPTDDDWPQASRQRLARLYRVMRRALDGAHGERLAERVERAWLELQGPACVAGPEEWENAADFLALLDRLERESPRELIERLDEAMDDLYARGRPSRVQLMTIHKAKGLEFDVVILPRLHSKVGRNERRLIMAQPFTLEGRAAAAAPGNLATESDAGPARQWNGGALGDGILMAAVTTRRQNGPSLYDYLGAVDKERQDYETQRVLYVAATRARTELHLFGRYGYRAKDDAFTIPAGSFMKMLEPVFGPAAETLDYTPGASDDSTEEAPLMPLLRLRESLPAGIMPGAAPEDAAHEGSVAPQPEPEPEAFQLPGLPDRNAAALGDALHQMLECLFDFAGGEAARAWATGMLENDTALRSLIRNAGAETGQLEALTQKLRAFIRTLLQSDAGRELLAVAPNAAFAELPLMSRAGHRIAHHIIDLAFRDTQGRWHIVDYKTGADTPQTREAWRAQLSRYATLLEAVTGTAPHRLAIYLAATGTTLNFDADGLEDT
ncbi:UvrD-helicase domain-containing protein [Elongatibacter sediminis]|uniref:DNA 3'-5' helicase n=1 Tax=Elongatibacter sediminis TaxID=3119006 RepID=A0AAW9RGT9_9GAMM